jgi:chemotaxis protein CheY-P-specific phosphatase CheC
MDIEKAERRQRLEQYLLSAVEETMENMVFEEVEIASGTEWKKNDLFWACLPIIKPVCGNITLLFPRKVASTITRDIYTDDEHSISEDIILDAVAELINTLTGCLVKRLVSEEEDFELGLPERGIGIFTEPDNNSISQTFMIGDKFLRVIVSGEICEFIK